MTTSLIKSCEIDGMQVEIRIENERQEEDDKVIARFMYELLFK